MREPAHTPDTAAPFFSIIMPARNEEGCIEQTCSAIQTAFADAGIDDFEIVIVNDHSTDSTESILQKLTVQHSNVRTVNTAPPYGFGRAIRRGLDEYRGEAACIVMADLSDSPTDILAYYQAMKAGAECVFGSRFVKGSRVTDYPRHKYIINRFANTFIRCLFGIKLNDTTNAFKCYRRTVINGIQPLLSHHFNITVEMPLKAIVRGYTYETLPISWSNRKAGTSKLKIEEMGSRYLFITLYVLLEKWLSHHDYHRDQSSPAAS